jgi:phospholipid transport system transporter-binding protein
VISIAQQTITLSGHLTMLNTPAIYTQGLQALSAGEWRVDCAQLESSDSSAVALLLAWLRAAQAKNCQLSVSGLPSSLLSLASLYGVDEMLPVQVTS